MKCDELTPIELECNMGPDVNGVVQREPWKAYDIDEVNLLLDEKDTEIASLKAENESLKAKLDTVNELVKTSKDLYDHTIESLKASHYADSVDAGMRERKLKRALWLARAELCRRLDVDRYLRKHLNSWYNENLLTFNDACVAMEVKMCDAESKCIAKAEEYK